MKNRTITFLFAVIFAVTAVCSVGTEKVEASTSLKVSPTSKTIYVGDKLTLRANLKVKWSVVNNKTNVKFTSRSTKKATIKGLKAGTVYVKAKSGKKVKKVKIVVRSKVPTAINAVSTSDIVGVGNHCKVYVKSVSPSYASQAVTFASSDDSIATVNTDGMVEGVSAGTVTIYAKSKLNSARMGSVTITVVNTLKGTVHMSTNLADETKYPKGKTAEIWIPIPQPDEFQVIPPSTKQWKAPSASTSKLTTDSEGNTALYIKWDENVEPQDRTVSLSYEMRTQEIISPANLETMEQGEVDVNAMSRYLKESSYTGAISSENVQATADQIVADSGAVTVYQKAYAIYDWVCENLAIAKGDNSARAYADVNLSFVALCRAEGIPARCNFGLKMDSLQNGALSQSIQNCRTQFYLPGYGWVYEDASAVLKEISGYEKTYRVPSDQWNKRKLKYWGTANESWLKLSSGTGITLSPSQRGQALDFYVYPYAEYDGNPVDLDYKYSFDILVVDCGCD